MAINNNNNGKKSKEEIFAEVENSKRAAMQKAETVSGQFDPDSETYGEDLNLAMNNGKKIVSTAKGLLDRLRNS